MTFSSLSTPQRCAEWVYGWCASRGFDAPQQSGVAFWSYPNEDGRERELLWPDPGTVIDADLLATIGASSRPTWVAVATHDVSSTQGILAERGVVPAGWPEWLMSTELGLHDQAACPDGFTSTIELRDGVLTGEVRGPANELACSGRMALTPRGGAVADRIVTEEGFRRRGFGRYIMSELGSAAQAAGATYGLLIASVEGHALYEAISWSSDCDIVVARNTAAMA